MTTDQAVARLTDVIRRKHFALSTEQSYCGWLKRYCSFIQGLPSNLKSEHKLEQFLTRLAKDDVSASTQNQAFNAILFFYKEAMGTELKNINALRARRPEQIRRAPSREETLQLIKAVQSEADFATSLAVRLLYGSGLRVTEPLNLRVKDVNLESMQLTIRDAKGEKDRVVSIPCSVEEDLREQLSSARAIWKRDEQLGIPVVLPHQLASKYPKAQFDWNWAWVFPANEASLDSSRRKMVRSRLHESKVQRAIRKACRKEDLTILPSELGQALAAHSLDRKTNPRAIQMGQEAVAVGF